MAILTQATALNNSTYTKVDLARFRSGSRATLLCSAATTVSIAPDSAGTEPYVLPSGSSVELDIPNTDKHLYALAGAGTPNLMVLGIS